MPVAVLNSPDPSRHEGCNTCVRVCEWSEAGQPPVREWTCHEFLRTSKNQHESCSDRDNRFTLLVSNVNQPPKKIHCRVWSIVWYDTVPMYHTSAVKRVVRWTQQISRDLVNFVRPFKFEAFEMTRGLKKENIMIDTIMTLMRKNAPLFRRNYNFFTEIAHYR